MSRDAMCTSCALFFSSEEDSVQGTPLTGLTLFLGVHIGRNADGLQIFKSSLLFLKSTPRVEEEELTIFPRQPKPH